MRIPDRIFGGKGHPLTLQKIPCNFCGDIFIRSISGRGIKKGGTWRTLGLLIGDLEDRVILDVMDTLKVSC